MAWRIAYTQFDGKTIGFHIVDTKGSTLPVVESGNGWETPEQLEKHARLIAAAPEMLEALKIAAEIAEKNYQAECFEVDWHNNNTPGVGQNTDYKTSPPRPKWLESARAAIARAEGAQPEQEHTGEPDPTDLARDYNESAEHGNQPTEYDP